MLFLALVGIGRPTPRMTPLVRALSSSLIEPNFFRFKFRPAAIYQFVGDDLVMRVENQVLVPGLESVYSRTLNWLPSMTRCWSAPSA